MIDRFEICLPFTLAQECPYPDNWENPKNYSNDAHDPGGETWCGIIQREYDAYRKEQGEVCRDISACTEAEGHDIYRNNYWLPHCPLLRPGLDLAFFDACVNEGCTEATRILQWALNVVRDGEFGPHTSSVASGLGLDDLPAAIRSFTKRRAAVYRLMPGFPYFGKGWLARAAAIGDAALKMVPA